MRVSDNIKQKLDNVRDEYLDCAAARAVEDALAWVLGEDVGDVLHEARPLSYSQVTHLIRAAQDNVSEEMSP